MFICSRKQQIRIDRKETGRILQELKDGTWKEMDFYDLGENTRHFSGEMNRQAENIHMM